MNAPGRAPIARGRSLIARERAEAGFAIPIVLVAMTALGLALMTAADTSEALDKSLRQARDDMELEIAATGLEARFAQLLLTEPIDQRGLRVGGSRLDGSGVLAPPRDGSMRKRDGWARKRDGTTIRSVVFDGRDYGADGMSIAVQDEAGLINVNGGDEAAVARVLQGLAVPALAARHLAATLADYIDEDQLRRPAGAEARDYSAGVGRAGDAGRPGYAERMPRNSIVARAQSSAAAFDWRRLLNPAQLGRFHDVASARDPDAAFNVNTAPAPVLAAMLGMDARAVGTVLKVREYRALTSASDVADVTGVASVGGVTRLGGLPAPHLRFTAWRNGQAHAYRSRISFAGANAARPLLIEPAAPFRLPAPRERRRDDGDVNSFPDSPALLAARKR